MGGSSQVYCGHLKDGGIIAVKRMKSLGGPDAESDFLTEVINLPTKEKFIFQKLVSDPFIV